MRLNELFESSGHIPKDSEEAKDPRWSNALTVDIQPGETHRQAAKMGWKTDKDGLPPKLSTSGKISETSMDVGVQARQPISPGSYGLMRSRVDYGLSLDSKKVIKGAVDNLAASLKEPGKANEIIERVAAKFKMKVSLLKHEFEQQLGMTAYDYQSRQRKQQKKEPIKI